LCNGAEVVIFGNFLHPIFSASLVQYISYLHSKFARGNMVDIQSAAAKIMRGKNQEEERKKETGQKYNVCICYAGRP